MTTRAMDQASASAWKYSLRSPRWWMRAIKPHSTRARSDMEALPREMRSLSMTSSVLSGAAVM